MNKFLKSIVNFLILTSVSQVVIAWSNTFSPRAEKNEPIKFALLIGGVVRDYDNHESFFANIVYVHKALKKLNYRDDNIKVLFFGGKKVNHSIIEGYATKKNFIDELFHFVDIIDSNDSLLIFRSGHGTVELIGEETIGVMNFPDGCLNSLEFTKIIEKINAKQIVIILNQCFCGQFTDISKNNPNVVVVCETKETELAIHESRKTIRWEHREWPFVKCFFDGFFQGSKSRRKKSVSESFQYMLDCNPNIKGVPMQADRPLLKEHPIICYGSGLKKGYVYIY